MLFKTNLLFKKDHHLKYPMKCVILFISCLFLANCIEAQEIRYGSNLKTGKYYPVRDINIYTEEYGSGKPLVMIHGNGGDISSMASIIPCFSKTYRTIILDSRAHGKSIDTGASLSFEMMADDVASLLDQMKIDSAYIIGWSDGGIIALELAMRHPEKVIKLASTGANLWPDSTALLPEFWKDEKKQYDSQKDTPKTSPEEKNSWKVFMLDWEQPNILLTALKKIQTPSLIIAGDHDLIRIEHTVLIFQNIPGAQLWILPNCSHGTLIEYPKEFYEKINQFFTSE
jgi:pimeloyl-ACP methyl ester carboxylesterase